MRNVFATTLVISLTQILNLCPLASADEEIVVTATRARARVRTLPAEIDVIDAGAARARGETTLAEALRAAPGLGVVASGGVGQQTSLFAGGANSNHALVLYDGLRINDPSTPGSSFDAGQDLLGELERIEVVQGPMSAVFGSDAIGAVVNLLPRHGGPGPLNARLDLAGGSFGTLNGAASLDGTLGAFRYAVTGEGFATDGYDLVPERMSTRTGERDGASVTNIAGVFDLKVSDALSFDLLARQRRAQADFDPFPFDFVTFREFRAEDDDLEISRNDLTLARLGGTWTFNDTLSLRASYGGMRQERVQSDDGADTDLFTGERRFGDLTLTWRRGDNTAFVAGLSTENEKIDIAQGFGFSPPFSFVTAEKDHLGGYLTAQSRFGRVSVTGAARLDDYESFGTHATWRLGASVELTQATRLYAAYGTSFRAPTLYERFVSFGDPNLDPEESKAWEIGANASVAAFGQGAGVELGVLYRHSDISNLIDFGPLFTFANVDRAAVETAQARVALRPFDWLTARVTYVYTDARDEIADTPLLRRPKSFWTASLAVTHGAFRADLSWRDVGARADQLYGDDGFALGIGDTPSYAVTRFSASYDIRPAAELFIAADNLFDETYEPVNAFAGAPRNAIVGVRLKTGS